MNNNDETGNMTQARPASMEKKAIDPLALPAAGKGQRVFASVIFALLGIALIVFVLLNPFSLPFLPQLGGGGARDEGGKAGRTTGTASVYYQCPMHPEVLESEPGYCPICQMKLVPVKANEMDPSGTGEVTAKNEHEILIDPVQVQNIGVVSEPVRRTDLARVIRTVGILDFDADNVYWINTKYSGWIEKVYVNYSGQDIHEGMPLFEVYSPELVTTQEEYLRALEYSASLSKSAHADILRQAEELLESTRQRLIYWDISPRQIADLEKSRKIHRTLKVTSPVDGVVVEVLDEALEGMFVRPGMNLYKLADLSSIWVHVDAYESDLAWIEEGLPAEVQLAYLPGRTFRGKVLFLQPELDRKTRTAKVCVELPNHGNRLKPGMYANVRIKGKGRKNVVAVPDSAILRSGERNVVFLDLSDGRFLPREVEIGFQGEKDLVEIRRGLTGGERVVVQAQFMLDSESRIQEAIRKFVSGKERFDSSPIHEPAEASSGPEHEH